MHKRGVFWEPLEGDEGRGLEVRDGVVGDDAVSAVGQCSGGNAGNRGDTALVSDCPHRRQGIQGLLGVGAELDGFAGSCTCVAVPPDLDLLVHLHGCDLAVLPALLRGSLLLLLQCVLLGVCPLPVVRELPRK